MPKKIFGKIPIFDIILIVMLVVFTIGAYLFFTTGERIQGTNEKIIYTVDFIDISDMIDSMPQPGEIVKDVDTNNIVGTVVSSERIDFENYWYDNTSGKAVRTVYDDRHTVRVVISADAKVSDTGIYVNNVRLRVSRALNASIPSLSASGIIMSIDII